MYLCTINNNKNNKIMKAKRFNKSEIMKRAHNCYRKHSDSMTFSQCLKWSWKKAVEELKKNNFPSYVIYSVNKRKNFYKKFDEQLNREDQHVTFGRNDWAVTYKYGYKVGRIHA